MEEVDKIITQSLRDIGCKIDDETETLDKFTTDIVVEAAAKCLNIIIPSLNLPTSLPINMAARFQVGAALADGCKELGFSREIGYQTFLYSNVNEIRKVFIFLIEKLPREHEKPTPDDHYDQLTKLKNDIGKSLRVALTTRLYPDEWNSIPFVSLPLETGITVPGKSNCMNPQDWRDFCSNKLQFITEQVDPNHILPSIISLNSTLNAKGLKPSSDDSPGHPPPQRSPQTSMGHRSSWLSLHQIQTPPPVAAPRSLPRPAPRQIVPGKTEEIYRESKKEDENEDELREKLAARIDHLQVDLKSDQEQLRNLNEECTFLEKTLKASSKEIQAFLKALELLPEADSSVSHLNDDVAKIKQRLLSLSKQWESHRKPLVEKYKAEKQKLLAKADEGDRRMDVKKELQKKIADLKKQIVHKRAVRDKLQEEYEKLPQNIRRSSYTVRILEIISNIKKQKDEIDKILKDTNVLQRGTNTLRGSLDRSFLLVNETISKNANSRNDEYSRKVHKHLTILHSDCNDLVEMVLETGAIVREILGLEEQITYESSKNIGSNLERLTADLQLMIAENEKLAEQLNASKK